MGCDIHTMAEVKVTDYSQHLGGEEYAERWKAVKAPVFPYAYHRSFEPIDLDNYSFTSVPYQGRNYDLFAVLADVRNGVGFAGVRTGDHIEPIAQPRGVPEDASKRWQRYVKSWGADLHSVSYFTLAELDEAMPLLTQHQRKTGVISEGEYLRLKRDGGTPMTWSGNVGGGGIRVVTVDEYEHGVRADADAGKPAPVIASGGSYGFDMLVGPGATNTYIRYHWETSLAEDTRYFVENTMEGLRRIAPRVGRVPEGTWEARRAAKEAGEMWIDPRPIRTDAVRIMFGFDN